MKSIIITLLLFGSLALYGNGITVSNVSFNDATNQLSFDITWNNSWFISGTPTTFDAAWVFIKYAPNGGDVWHHASVLDSTPVAGFLQFISYDDLGIMVYQSTSHIGTSVPSTTFTVELEPLLGAYQDFKVFAIEMVHSDEGRFFAGDGSSPGRFYVNGDPSQPWEITNENAFTRGNTNGTFNQEGVSSGTDIHAGYPKGYQSEFVMKYKITAQQYVDFLNCLTRQQQNTRTNTDLSGTSISNKYVMTNTASPINRNPIACDESIGTGAIEFYCDLDETNPPNADNDGANVALNHMKPADILAYMDWSGLRPMSELEYEKFSRGRDMPVVSGEYAWGTATVNPAGSITNSGAPNESTSNVGILPTLFKLDPLRAGFAATATSNRTAAGATFIGMMDVHNLGEFMYGVESNDFSEYQYGDGQLNANGGAEVAGWTTNFQLLTTLDLSSPIIMPISQGKIAITTATRSAYMGARGVRKLLQ